MGRKEEGVLRIEMRIRFAQSVLGQRPSAYDRGDRHTSGHKRVNHSHQKNHCSPQDVFRLPSLQWYQGRQYSHQGFNELKHAY